MSPVPSRGPSPPPKSLSSSALSLSPPITVLSIPFILLGNTGEILDRAKSNWSTWEPYILRCLRLCALSDYILGSIPCPDPAADPVSARNWHFNDGTVLAFLEHKVSEEEQKFIRTHTSALSAWTALKIRHSDEGVCTQILLIRQLLAIRFHKSKHLATTCMRIQELCNRIIAIGLPSLEVLTSVGLLNALKGDFEHLQSQIFTALLQSSSYTSTDIINRLDLEQQMLDRRSTALPEALVVKGGRSHMMSKKICVNCKRSGHLADSCWQPGGGSGGQT